MGFHSTAGEFTYNGSCNSRRKYKDNMSICSRDSDGLTCSSLDKNSIERKNSVTERFNNILDSIRLFFGSVTIKPRCPSDSSTRSKQIWLDSTSHKSSGYQSLDNSLELEESYIKVSKFTEHEEQGEYGHYGTYKEYKEMAQQQSLASEIKDIVEYHPDMKISDYLTLRTAGDVMNLSKCEPYGLKGCKLIVIIEEGTQVTNLGSIFPEKGIVCTFEITLVLHLRQNPCRKIPFFNCKRTEMRVLEQYELRKEKMYTSKGRRSSPTFRS